MQASPSSFLFMVLCCTHAAVLLLICSLAMVSLMIGVFQAGQSILSVNTGRRTAACANRQHVAPLRSDRSQGMLC
jgi:hypothetical protein